MIKIKDLHIELKGFTLSDINLEIEPNEFFVLMGPTGAGKTVLLEAIAGLCTCKKRENNYQREGYLQSAA